MKQKKSIFSLVLIILVYKITEMLNIKIVNNVNNTINNVIDKFDHSKIEWINDYGIITYIINISYFINYLWD